MTRSRRSGAPGATNNGVIKKERWMRFNWKEAGKGNQVERGIILGPSINKNKEKDEGERRAIEILVNHLKGK